MLEIFKWNGNWRIKIVNETLEFEDQKMFQEILDDLLEIKEEFEPHKR